ncbi:MAG: ketopantoate reductase family protein [Promethearchaeota archaeon]|nr:MAG: ketopantoate reductase family protein [Candidatus Lokiarchaeota archaeon]
MTKKELRIGFIGAGSIGSLFGGYLADIKSDIYSISVIFFCNKAHADEINKKGLKLYINQQTRVIENIEAYENEQIIKDKTVEDPSFEFDFLFLTTKAYDSEAAIIQYKNLVEKSKWLVILQNGIGNEDIVIPYCQKSKILRVVTTNGALLEKPGHIIHTGHGITKIGFPYLDELEIEEKLIQQGKEFLILLNDLMNLAGLETVVVEDIIRESWEKVIVNIGINPLGALTRLTNGELLKNNGLKEIMREAINEAIQVAEMKNIKLSKKDYVEITHEVARKTAENKNSMLQDILNGQLTEIEFMNGRILKYAKELGIKVPYNKTLTHLVRGLESSRR